jgi:hypothetical protein
MTDDLHHYSDDELIAEVARRLGLRASSSPAEVVGADLVTLHVGLPDIVIPDGLAKIRYDSDAIRELLWANSRRIGLRRCEIADAFYKAGRKTSFNIDQKVQHLKGELIRKIGPDGHPYWRMARPRPDQQAS